MTGNHLFSDFISNSRYLFDIRYKYAHYIDIDLIFQHLTESEELTDESAGRSQNSMKVAYKQYS